MSEMAATYKTARPVRISTAAPRCERVRGPGLARWYCDAPARYRQTLDRYERFLCAECVAELGHAVSGVVTVRLLDLER